MRNINTSLYQRDNGRVKFYTNEEGLFLLLSDIFEKINSFEGNKRFPADYMA